EVHEAEVRALLGKLGPVDAAELARRRAAPILETHLGVEADGSFEGRMRYAAVNAGPSALEAVAFDVPANAGSARGQPPLAMTSARVGGAEVTARGTTARWEVPVRALAGERFEVEIAFRGRLPEAPADDAAAAGGHDPASPFGDGAPLAPGKGAPGQPGGPSAP